ncbi:MAG: hypothetical protein Q9183_005162 [Haloplaca sp. 2 TL-2023]
MASTSDYFTAGRPRQVNGFDTRSGLILCYANSRTLDSQKKLPFSELLYQTWKTIQRHQRGGPLSTLRTIVRQGVTLPATLDVIAEIYQRFRLPPDTMTWYPWTEAETREAFYALLGTDSLVGVVILLRFHVMEVGRKEVTTIWTRRAEGANLDIWIEIWPAEIGDGGSGAANHGAVQEA